MRRSTVLNLPLQLAFPGPSKQKGKMQLIKLANNVQIETKEKRVFAFDQTKNSDQFYKTFLNPQVATKLARLTLENFFHLTHQL
jgi:hypothetical protein